MNIIIRSIGERTEKECIRLAEKQGNVHVVKSQPFGQSIYDTYMLAIELGQEWIPVIDADVLLYDGQIEIAMKELKNQSKDLFCLDGKTDDKILRFARRAGVHIYRTDMLCIALDLIEFNHIKPESNVRRQMAELGFNTWAGGGIIFGKHDHEQYYRDLWRKSVCQVHKLAKMIERKNIVDHWKEKAKSDNDYKVILAGHEYGLKNVKIEDVRIDINIDFDAVGNVRKLGLEEKDDYNG